MVFVIDDDAAVRRSLCLLIATLGVEVRGHDNGRAFLDDARLAEASCVVLDQHMPGLAGLDVLARLQALNPAAQVIFISGHADVPLAVAAMRNGAVDFLQKPFDNRMLLEQVSACVARGRAQRETLAGQAHARHLLARLSAREGEVLDLVVKGCMNKVIAAELGISEKTVEDHRAHLMKKLEVRSLAALVQRVTLARQDLTPR